MYFDVTRSRIDILFFCVAVQILAPNAPTAPPHPWRGKTSCQEQTNICFDIVDDFSWFIKMWKDIITESVKKPEQMVKLSGLAL